MTRALSYLVLVVGFVVLLNSNAIVDALISTLSECERLCDVFLRVLFLCIGAGTVFIGIIAYKSIPKR